MSRAAARPAARRTRAHGCPVALKVRGGELKHSEARVGRCAPEQHPASEKRGFGAPMGAWLRVELAPMLRRRAVARVDAARGLLDPDAVDRTIREHE